MFNATVETVPAEPTVVAAMVPNIPTLLVDELVPNGRLSIMDLLNFCLPPLTPLNDANQAKSYVVEEAPEEFAVEDVGCIQAFPVPASSKISQIRELVDELAEDSQSNAISIIIPNVPGSHRFPSWILTYWEAIREARMVREQWRRFEESSKNCSAIALAIAMENIRVALNDVPWKGPLLGFTANPSKQLLVQFATPDWLTDDHEALLLELLEHDVILTGQSDVDLVNMQFIPLLLSAYNQKDEYSDKKSWGWMREKGHAFGTGLVRQIGAVVNVDSVHWAALLLDSETHTIWYGDSKGWAIDDKLEKTLKWWTYFHSGEPFIIQHLPISRQYDNHSCGLLAWNALAAFLLPDVNLYREAPDYVFRKRVEAMLRIINHHKSQSGQMPEADSVEAISRSATVQDWSASDIAMEDLTSHTIPLKRPRANSGTDNNHPPKRVERPIDISSSSADAPGKRVQVASNTRVALELSSTQPKGILRFFSQATGNEKRLQLAREMQELNDREEDDQHHIKHAEMRRKMDKRERNRLRQQKHREKKKSFEIHNGARSPGGHKRKVHIVEMSELKDDISPLKNVPNLTRPAREILHRYKEKHRKPQGRKRKHPVRAAKYNNWHTPACFSQVVLAAKAVGWQMSSSAIVSELKRRDPRIFENISRTTVESWIDRSGDKPRWTKAIQAKIDEGTGNMPGHNKGGQTGIIAKYPDIMDGIRQDLEHLRDHGAPLTVITVRGLIVARILQRHPEIFERRFRDGSRFKVSESYVRQLLRGSMNWSMRRATQASQKRPENWEDLCEEAFMRMAFVIKEEDIPAALYVNSDQTQVVYAPGNRMTWAPAGAKQVSLVGADEKRAFTLLVSVAADGTLLPFQAIYKGETNRSCPSKTSPNLADILDAGMRLEFSGTSTYWSNQRTMRLFVDEILAPYYEQVKQRLGLPSTQRSLWQIDVWSVHRSEEFRDWLRAEHPTILFRYVPPGCTGAFQPCDVGIQRPLKLSIRRSYHEDIVNEMSDQLKKEGRIGAVDERLGVLRDRSVRWIWNAFKALSDQGLVQKAFKMCNIRDKYNLSYESLTSHEARQALRNLRTTKPALWNELHANEEPGNPVTDGTVPLNEDAEEPGTGVEDIDADDCDVSMKKIIKAIVHNSVPNGMVARSSGACMASGVAENAEDVEDADEKVEDKQVEEKGRGKRKRQANRRYSAHTFWQHHDNDASDVD